MLMIVYGIDADAASTHALALQEGNVKLRCSPSGWSPTSCGSPQHEQAPGRSAYDNLLLTADQRIREG